MTTNKKEMELRFIHEQLQKIQAHAEKLDSQVEELSGTVEALKDLPEKGKDILVPIANGIFLKAKSEDNKELVVNVGSKVTVKKTTQSTVTMLEKQIKDMEQYRQQLVEQFETLAQHAMKLEQGD
jgi:prefoldin alpha subunit